MIGKTVSRLVELRKVDAVRNISRGLAGGALLQVANKALGLTSSVLMAQLLGVDGFGLFAFCLAAGAIMSVPIEWGQAPLILRETARADSVAGAESADGHLGQSLLLLVGCGLATAAFVAALIGLADLGLSRAEQAALLIAVPLALLTAGVRVLAAALTGLRRLLSGQVVEQLLAPAALVLGVVFLTVAGRASPYAALVAQLTALAVPVAWGLYALRHAIGGRAHPRAALRQLTARGWPFLLIGSALVLNQQIDAIIIGFVIGTYEVGVYRVATQLATTAIFPAILVNTVVSPYVVRLVNSGNMAGFNRLFYGATALNVAGAGTALLIFAIYGEPIVQTLYGRNFQPAVMPLILLTAGYLVNCLFGPTGTVLAMTGHERVAARVLATIAVVNATLCILVAPVYGVVGVAATSATSIAAYQLALRIAQRRLLHL